MFFPGCLQSWSSIGRYCGIGSGWICPRCHSPFSSFCRVTSSFSSTGIYPKTRTGPPAWPSSSMLANLMPLSTTTRLLHTLIRDLPVLQRVLHLLRVRLPTNVDQPPIASFNQSMKLCTWGWTSVPSVAARSSNNLRWLSSKFSGISTLTKTNSLPRPVDFKWGCLSRES